MEHDAETWVVAIPRNNKAGEKPALYRLNLAQFIQEAARIPTHTHTYKPRQCPNAGKVKECGALATGQAEGLDKVSLFEAAGSPVCGFAWLASSAGPTVRPN